MNPVADMLRKSKKPILVVVNKIDSVAQSGHAYEFYALGLGDPIAVSSVNMMNFGDLLEELMKLLPPEEGEREEGQPIQVAVVGKPNVGKSSLVNRLLGEDRVMVSDIAGTTRDAVDTRFADEGEEYVLIDTAGIRRKRAIEYQSLERVSVCGRLRPSTVGRVLMLNDATDGVTDRTQDRGLHRRARASPPRRGQQVGRGGEETAR